MKRSRICGIVLVGFLLVGLGFTCSASAAPAADQQCSSIGASFLDGIGVHQPAGQTFTPTQSSIIGFSIYVYSVSNDTTQMTANIRLGGIGGAVLAAFVFSIPGNYGSPTGNWYPVQFPSGVHVNPGSMYAIDLVETSGSGNIKWSACSTPYSGGCGYADGVCQANSWTFIEYAGDFSISLSSSTLVLTQGSTGSVNVLVSSLDNFASPVALSMSGPTGIGGSFSNNPITPAPTGSASSTLNLFVPGNIVVGTYTLTITGSSGSTTHTTALTLNVVAAGASDFAATTGPTVVLNPGSTGTAMVFITAFDGFDSQVGLAASWIGVAPADVTFTLPSPVTPPTGGTATSTLTINAGPSAVIGTYTLGITATSGTLSHAVNLNVVIAPAVTTTTTTSSAASDFSITASSKTISIIQGLSGSTTIIVSSLGGFNSPVTFSASWVGNSPAGVGFTLPAPITPPAGGAGSSPMGITTTSTASTGSYDLRITGSSSDTPHSVDLTVQVSSPGPQCIIATAAYGSAVSPEVELLRNYRDSAILKTNLGSSFMIVFNAWYYSFSPRVANYIANRWMERMVMRAALYPLVGILWLSYGAFKLTSAYPEFAVLVSGLVASSLIGAVYFGLPATLFRRRIKSAMRSINLLRSLTGAFLLAGLGLILPGEVLKSTSILMLASIVATLSTAFLSAIVTYGTIVRFLDPRWLKHQ